MLLGFRAVLCSSSKEMVAAVNKGARVLLLMVGLLTVGGGSVCKWSVRGGRCGGVLLGEDFVLGPRRRGDACSGVVVRSWSLFRSFNGRSWCQCRGDGVLVLEGGAAVPMGVHRLGSRRLTAGGFCGFYKRGLAPSSSVVCGVASSPSPVLESGGDRRGGSAVRAVVLVPFLWQFLPVYCTLYKYFR